MSMYTSCGHMMIQLIIIIFFCWPIIFAAKDLWAEPDLKYVLMTTFVVVPPLITNLCGRPRNMYFLQALAIFSNFFLLKYVQERCDKG